MCDEETVDYEQEMIRALETNPLYKNAVKNLSPEELERLKGAVHGYLSGFAKRFLNPLSKEMSSPEFRKEFAEQLEKKGHTNYGEDEE